MNEAQDLLDAIEIIVDRCIKNQTAIIDKGFCRGVNGNRCSIELNGKTNSMVYYGPAPSVGRTYPVFIPYGNLSNAFVINAG